VERFVAYLVEPLPLELLALLAATVWLWRKRRGRRRRLIILTVVAVLLTVSCTNLVGYPAMGSLEWMYPADTPLPERADAIVVLGGGLTAVAKAGVPVQLASSTVYRCLKAAEVYHHAGSCLVVASGGRSRSNATGPTEAEAIKALLVRLNVDPNDILLETTSQTTYENAVETCKELEGHGLQRIVLVTDAAHLFRAQHCFKACGYATIPVGCNYRATRFDWGLRTFLPSSEAVQNVHVAFHEWSGILYYWLRGRLS